MSTNITTQQINLDQLSNSIQRDIDSYFVENRIHKPEDMTVYDALHAWLMWNGIIGFTSDIAAIVGAGKK